MPSWSGGVRLWARCKHMMEPGYVRLLRTSLSSGTLTIRRFVRSFSQLEECPICFLYYPVLNTSLCCQKRVCTECFLQVKTLKA